jgi:phosphoribosylpyrophosphate synthetase
MIFKNKRHNQKNKIGYLGYYHSRRGGYNPLFDTWSELILELKKSRGNAITYFTNLISPLLTTRFAIAVVPSHKPSNLISGIGLIAKELVKRNNLIDATSCLVRTKEIEKLSYGGNRSIEVHLNSIKLKNLHLIKDREVLILDDVTTTGNSLAACKKILLNAGVDEVYCLSISKTFNKLWDNKDIPNGSLRFIKTPIEWLW